MTEHDRTRLGPYVLGGLDPAEHREVAEHVAGCAECRAEVAEFEELKEFLGEVPPEAFLDGPPEGGDLMLQRTLQAVRTEAETTPTAPGDPQTGPASTGPTATAPGSPGPAADNTRSGTPAAPDTDPARHPGAPTVSSVGPEGRPGASAVSGAGPERYPGASAVSDLGPERHLGGPTASGVGPEGGPGASVVSGVGLGAADAHHLSGGTGLPPGSSEPGRARSGGRRGWLLAAAAVVLLGGVLTGGIVIGRQTVDPVVSTPQPTLAPGSREVTTTDPVSRVTMATTLEPRQDWSYVHVKLTGVPAGSECELIVTDRAGKGWIAGSWIIGEKGAREGARFGGGVVVPADQVTSVQLKTLQGKVLASTRF